MQHMQNNTPSCDMINYSIIILSIMCFAKTNLNTKKLTHETMDLYL
jgi:spore coat protein CotF